MSFRANILLFLVVFAGFYLIIFLQHEMRSPSDQIQPDVFSGLKKGMHTLRQQTQKFQSFLHTNHHNETERVQDSKHLNDDGGASRYSTHNAEKVRKGESLYVKCRSN